MKASFRSLAGGITAPQGIRASGVRCGIKTLGKDLALVVCDQPCAVAGVFTTNRFRAAPVQLSQRRIRSGFAQAVVINSGNANACTGPRGRRDARAMVRLSADALGISETHVLVASTGIIGHHLPMDRMANGIKWAARDLSADGGADAARAIMTTDMKRKEAAVEFTLAGHTVRVGGMAKGSGMIAPSLATMISVLTTDVAASPALLKAVLRRAAERSFNSITVDGDTSTNDTLLLFATGASGAKAGSSPALFEQAVTEVATLLAQAIVRDGEGATKLIAIEVRGARTERAARQVAKTIANSPLVKTACFGSDPNWGRVLAAAGRAGVAFAPERVDLSLGGIQIVRGGQPLGFDQQAAQSLLRAHECRYLLDLHQGRAAATVWTCDLSYDYIKINAAYHT